MSAKLCYCVCHDHPGTYYAEPCSTCGHYDSRGQSQGYHRGWLAYDEQTEMDRLYEYLAQFKPITGGIGSPVEQVKAIVYHYATQAGRMHKGTGGWAPKEKKA